MDYERQERIQREERRIQKLYQQFVIQLKEAIDQEDYVAAKDLIRQIREAIPITEQRLIELVPLEQQIKLSCSKLKKVQPVVVKEETLRQARQMIQEKIVPSIIIEQTQITPKQLEAMIEVEIAEGNVLREEFFEGESLKGIERIGEIDRELEKIETYINIGGGKMIKKAKEMCIVLKERYCFLTPIQQVRLNKAADRMIQQEKLQEARRYVKQGSYLENAVRLQPNIELSTFYQAYIEERVKKDQSSR